MTPPPDGSRDRRIEDPTNLWIVHPLSRLLLRPALRGRVSANAVSVAGLAIGAGAALAFSEWRDWRFAIIGLLLATAWLVADGLDGMVARATGTTSALGRMLDGLCDHGVFVLIYVSAALSIGTAEGWTLAAAAGVSHAVQSSLYEGERARYHRRIRGIGSFAAPVRAGNPVVRFYDHVAFSMDRLAAGFDARLAGSDARELAAVYGERAAPPMRLLALLSANARVLVLFLACLVADPRLFWWVEIGPMTAIAVAGIAWHRRVETRLLRRDHTSSRDTGALSTSKD